MRETSPKVNYLEKFLNDTIRCHVLLQNIDDGIVIVQDNVVAPV
jgi:hypothetical protein